MMRGPSPRAVDWTILLVVSLQAVSGVASLLVGSIAGAWVFWAHSIGGLVLIGLVGLKLWRVRGRLRPGSMPAGATTSVILAAIALAALATGAAWGSGWRPWVARWTLLTIHAVLGLAIAIPLVFHLRRRVHRPRRADFTDRRTVLQFGLLVLVGTVAWRAQRLLTTLLDVPARFTGSYEVDSLAGNAFPTTSWVADDPDPVDPDSWRLAVRGAVERPFSLSATELEPASQREAILDCTSGWYSNQRWGGLSVGSLLDRATPTDEARWVSFHSVTGYRWSLPIEEAREALLATHVTGERLSHDHGFPLRLVAPERRGFQWVKWVETVEVRRTPDYGQWVAIFTSGFDGD